MAISNNSSKESLERKFCSHIGSSRVFGHEWNDESQVKTQLVKSQENEWKVFFLDRDCDLSSPSPFLV